MKKFFESIIETYSRYNVNLALVMNDVINGLR